MRLRWAKSISTFFRSRLEVTYGVGLRDVPGHVAGALVDRAQDLAGRRVWAALRLQRAGVAIELAGAVAHEAFGIDTLAVDAEGAAILVELLPARAGVAIAGVVIGEVGAAEGAVAALGFVEDWDMRLDPALMHQPGEVLGRAVGTVGGEPCRPETEAFLRPVEHGAGRADLGLADGATGLDIDDDGVVEVDEIVGGVGEEGMALQSAGPLRRRIGARDELRLRLAGRAPSGFIQRVEILAHRSTRPGEIVPIDRLGGFCRPLLVGVGLDQAGIDREAFAADQPFRDATPDGRLEQLAQEIALAEAAMTVLREGGMVGHTALQPEPAEPAIGEVQMNLLAQAALGADAKAVANEEHPDHQFRIDGGPSHRAVERAQMRADI